MGIYRPTTTETSNTSHEEEVLNGFADMLKQGGSEVTVVPEIQRHKYSKNFWNCVHGTTAAITRLPLPAIFRSPQLDPRSVEDESVSSRLDNSNSSEAPHAPTADVPYRTPLIREYTIPFLYDACTELYNLGSVLFPPEGSTPGLDPGIIDRTLKNTAKIHARTDSLHRPSMLVDVELNRPMELDVVVGEVVRLGREEGVPMPVSLKSFVVAVDCVNAEYSNRMQKIEALYALLLIVQEQLLHPGRGL